RVIGVGQLTDQKPAANTRAKGGLQLHYAALSASDLGGVARNEVVHRLLRSELCDPRQHPEGIGSQKDHVLRMAAASAFDVIPDVVQRIRRPGVLGGRLICEANFLRRRVEDDVLQYRAEDLVRWITF